MGYTLDPIEDGCYEGTTCLINKLDIRDEGILAKMEMAIVTPKMADLERYIGSNTLNFDYYREIHRYLFCDLYDWAGQVRTVNISKKGFSFVDHERIESISNAVFSRLTEKQYLVGVTRDVFLSEIVHFYDVTNRLHPFREGNGRTQRIFISHLAQNAGFNLDFLSMDHDELMIATIQSAQGVYDVLFRLFDSHLKNFDIKPDRSKRYPGDDAR